MNCKQRIINILYGSMLVGSLITVFTGWVITYQNNNADDISSWLYYGAVIVLLVLFIGSIRKYSQANFPAWLVGASFLLAVYGLYVTGNQDRELWSMLILPGAILGTIFIAFISSFFMKGSNDRNDNVSFRKPLIAFLLLVIVLPFAMTLYMRFQLLPKIRFYSHRPIEISYDQPSNMGSYGIKYYGPGLYLRYGADLRGNFDLKYELNAHAYLLSSDTGTFEDPVQYIRRARFEYRLHDGGEAMEGPDGWNDLFLPYTTIIEGTVQGGFDNYRPEPLPTILAKNENTQFAIEVIATVKKKPYDPYEERPVLKQVRQVVPMNYEQTSREQREKYLKSQWVAMVSGKEWTASAQPVVRQGIQPGDQSQVVQVPEESGNAGHVLTEQPVQEVTPVQQSNSDEDEWEDL